MGRGGKGMRMLSLIIALGVATVPGAAAGADAQPVRVGFISPLSGPFAVTGQQLLDGINLYLEKNRGRLGGRPVRLIVEDDLHRSRFLGHSLGFADHAAATCWASA
jgi:hypothetical protein